MNYAVFNIADQASINNFIQSHNKAFALDGVRFNPGSLFRPATVSFFYLDSEEAERARKIEEGDKVELAKERMLASMKEAYLNSHVELLNADLSVRQARSHSLDGNEGSRRIVEDTERTKNGILSKIRIIEGMIREIEDDEWNNGANSSLASLVPAN